MGAGFEAAMPRRRERLGSAVVTAGAAVLGAIVAGMTATFVSFVATSQSMSLMEHASVVDIARSSGIDSVSPWVWGSVDAFTFLVAVLTASRLGRGAVGDAVFGVRAVDRAGAPAGVWRILLNAALPIAAWVMAAPRLGTGGALVLTAALWALSLVRSDRRSVYSLITGTHYQTLVSDRTEVRDWAKIPRSEPDAIDPYQRGDASGAV